MRIMGGYEDEELWEFEYYRAIVMSDGYYSHSLNMVFYKS